MERERGDLSHGDKTTPKMEMKKGVRNAVKTSVLYSVFPFSEPVTDPVIRRRDSSICSFVTDMTLHTSSTVDTSDLSFRVTDLSITEILSIKQRVTESLFGVDTKSTQKEA